MHLSRRSFLLATTGTALATPLLAGAGPALAAGRPPAGSLPDAALTADLRAITEAGMPGVFAEARDGRDRWRGASGVADVTTGRPALPGFQHRVGSITKTFVAATLLQLVGERRIALDAPIGRYLPEFAVDGVTVRMLLNHTSGISDYDHVIFATPEDIERHRSTTFTPRQLVRAGLGQPPTGAPGAAFAYSNTNYILAGLIIERVTRRAATDEVHRRILRPLGLRQTYFPGLRPRIAGPHSRGYVPWYEGELRDFSVSNMSWAWTAGALVSTMADLNTFFRALLAGRLLRPAELAAMKTTVPFDPAQPEAAGYGLGLYRMTWPTGDVWGHDGLVFGHSAISLHTPDGRRQVSLAQNVTHYALPGTPDPIGEAVGRFLNTALVGESAVSARTATAAQVPAVVPAPGAPALVRPLPQH
ncbi:serine hydrolase domain-containing protein [Micromonospora echinospora]|uniref:serine hydrolase domain-containing protein n=1 Tax=Micromonospora echinospora TaxID=1877 RepID=UPI0037B11E77